MRPGSLNLERPHRTGVPEVAATVKPWPVPIAVTLLVVAVVVDLALWAYGFYELFVSQLTEDLHEVEGHLSQAGTYLTAALLVLLVFGWAWRWAVAAGYIGGRPTARFGGA